MPQMQLDLRAHQQSETPSNEESHADRHDKAERSSKELSARGSFVIGAVTALAILVYLQASGTLGVMLHAFGLADVAPQPSTAHGIHRHFLGGSDNAESAGPKLEKLVEENRLLRESEAQLRALVEQLESRLSVKLEELDRIGGERSTLLAERVELEAELETLREREARLSRWSGSGVSRNAATGSIDLQARIIDVDRELGVAVIDRGRDHGLREGARMSLEIDNRRLDLLVDEVRARVSIARVLSPGGASALAAGALVLLEKE